jgi:energy-coupling factor transporter ATP-binding protein EcfA2
MPAAFPEQPYGPDHASSVRARKNPYLGLRPFDEEDRDVFFGRSSHVDSLLERLLSRRFVAVVGPSGCGKSSLVRAGLIPALYDGLLEGSGQAWKVAKLRPGGDPAQALRTALLELAPEARAAARDDAADETAAASESPSPKAPEASDAGNGDSERFGARKFYVGEALDGSHDALARAAAQLTLGTEANLLILVDQFEELFRFKRRSGDETEWFERSNRFVQQLLVAASDPARGSRGRAFVVLTMRDEFVGKCALFPGLAEAMNAGLYLVPRLTRAQLMKAVRLPAKVGGREVSAALAERIINDSFSLQDELPVLQHALMRTWRAAKAGAATLELGDYKNEKVGTVADALDVHGEEIAAEDAPEPRLSPRQRGLLETVLKRLTLHTGEESTRSPASLGELAEVAGVKHEDADLRSVIERLRASDCQFLSPPSVVKLEPATQIDLTHEAILRRWARLKEWAIEERQDAQAYRRILDAALSRRERPDEEPLFREPQLSGQLAWWRKKKPSAAWARRYHPAVTKLGERQRERYVGGDTGSVDHAALVGAAQAFLDESEKERNREMADRQKARALRARLTSLAVLFGIASIASGAVALITEGARQEKDVALNEKISALNEATEANRQLLEAAKKDMQQTAELATRQNKLEKALALAQRANEKLKTSNDAKDEAVRLAREQEKAARAAEAAARESERRARVAADRARRAEKTAVDALEKAKRESKGLFDKAAKSEQFEAQAKECAAAQDSVKDQLRLCESRRVSGAAPGPQSPAAAD